MSATMRGMLAMFVLMLLPGAAGAQRIDALAAFERLKALEGVWVVTSTDAETGAVFAERARFEYTVLGAGSTLIERANAGTADEMVSVFHMDGDRLVLQHYCAAGNQPRLELTRADGDDLVFDLTGGANVDPAVDGHIHGARFTFGADGRSKSVWTWYEAGEAHHANRRVLRERVRAPAP